jgi:hypothetical protein
LGEKINIKHMKPKEKKPDIVFQIINRENGNIEGSYSRAYCTEYDFKSVSEARSSNCHDIYQNKKKYKINKYKVTYTLIEEDVDCEPNAQDEERI